MHLSDGVLPISTVAVGYLASGVGIGLVTSQMKAEEMPRIAVMSAAFFVASLIHVRLGAAFSVHLLLHGLVGIVLGKTALVAIALGLFLQAIEFGHGGLLNLGVNTVVMGLPAVSCGWCYRHFQAKFRDMRKPLLAGLLSALAVVLSAFLAAFALLTGGDSFREASIALLVTNIPIIPIEGIITAGVVYFLLKIKPEVLQ
jgi:cobalt/nickel transport system permease protein